MKFCLICLVFFNCIITKAQKWPIPLLIDESRYFTLPENLTLGDTIIIKHSSIIYYRFVFFDGRGKSYCEVYKNKLLYKKGYFENSLDTLKKYSYRKGVIPTFDKIYILRYFQPLKHGMWDEYRNGKCYRRRVFDLGVEVIMGKCNEIQ